jgi:hypothetical protein
MIRVLGLLLGMMLIAVANSPWLAVVATSFLAVVAWLFWIAFFCGLADYIEHPKLAEEAIRVTWSAFWLVVIWVLTACMLEAFLIFLLLLMSVGGTCSCFGPFSFAALIAGIIKYLLASGTFDTIGQLLLYPTGIPVVMRYMDLIGSTRMIILRRT